LKKAQVAAIGAMNDGRPLVTLGDNAQKNDPVGMLLFCGEIEVCPSDNRLLNFHPFISLKVYSSETWTSK
jgi:hypothetical protein